MNRVSVALTLFLLFILYSSLVYTKGTENGISLSVQESALVQEGKQLFQDYNCVSCHQIYGLGGYLGPELTSAYSDKNRGEGFMRALLKSGSQRMPDFGFSSKQIDAIIAYLKYVDSTAAPIKNH